MVVSWRFSDGGDGFMIDGFIFISYDFMVVSMVSGDLMVIQWDLI